MGFPKKTCSDCPPPTVMLLNSSGPTSLYRSTVVLYKFGVKGGICDDSISLPELVSFFRFCVVQPIHPPGRPLPRDGFLVGGGCDALDCPSGGILLAAPRRTVLPVLLQHRFGLLSPVKYPCRMQRGMQEICSPSALRWRAILILETSSSPRMCSFSP